jgi:hypothetical protein
MSEDPVLLEPGDVSDLPSKWINNGKTRPDHLLVIQIFDQLQRPVPSFSQVFNQLSRRTHRFELSDHINSIEVCPSTCLSGFAESSAVVLSTFPQRSTLLEKEKEGI